MDIIYYGHSCFKIAGKSASVVTDPFDPSIVGLKLPKLSADIVTLSHDHQDHNFLEGVADVHKVVRNPGEYEIMGISILAFPSFHDATKGADRGENIVYVFELEGFRVAHLGDLGHMLDDALLSSLGDIDVLLLPVGGTYTIDPEMAVKVTQAIEPKMVIPMHYKTSGLKEDLASNLLPVEDFVKALGRTEEHTKKLSLKPGGLLPEELKLIILDRA
jgi:L-ascorbate metabolism protein UlaG (beta-lactamase superfamily)